MSENENRDPIAEPSNEGSATPETAEAKPSNGSGAPASDAKPEAGATPAADAKPEAEPAKADAPAASGADEAKAEAPTADAPKGGDAKADAPKGGDAKADAPKGGDAKADAPKGGDAKTDAPKGGDAKADAPKGGAKADAPSGDAKADAPQSGDAKADAPKGGDAKAKADGGSSDGKKKRKRRRKKKKDGGEKKDQAFARFFEGSGPRQHAFRVGEVVAGRVTRVEDGAILVDLFGKAIAVADVLEPREVAESLTPGASESTAVGISAPTDAAKKEAVASEAKSPAADTPADAESDAPAGAAKADAPAEATAETPAAEVKADAPAEATVETPAAEAKAGAPATAETPAADAKADAPATAEAPAADAKADAPATTETPGAEAKADAPATTETPGAEAKADAPAAETAEAPAADAKAAKEEPAIEPMPLEPEPPHPEPPQVGAIFRGRVGSVAESGHIAIVNRNIERPRAKAAIKLAHDEKRRVPGVVFGYNRGGFDVLIAGIRCFAPARGMSLEMIDDPETLIGRKLEFSVPKSKGKSIVVTRRSILEKDARKAAKARLEELKVGEKITGKVTDVRDYGALVDIGGIDGLVHMSEIAWTRGGKPSDHVKVGDEVQVEVLKVQKMSRKDRYGKVSLSIRTCLPDPWDEHAELLQIGKPRKGKVVSLTDFGAFLELTPGIEGLLHISELDGKPAHAKDVLTEGEELDVVIDRKDGKQRRLSLSLLTPADLQAIEKGELDLSAAPRSTKKGDYVTVIVERTERHGLLVQVKGLIGKRGRGYVPMRELPEQGETKKRFSQGSEHEMKIIGTDREGRLRLSVTGKLRDEERKAVKEYRKEAATKGFGTFGDLLKSKLEK